MFSLPDLPYTTSDLEPYIDASTMEIHHGKHHTAYVKNLNDALPDKSDADLTHILSHLLDIPENIRTKVRNHGGGHYNHSLFWTCMTPKTAAPTGPLLTALTSTFGSLDVFKEKFTTTAMGRFGSGWAWLVADKTGLSVVDSANQDTPLSDGKIPLLGIDVWEHAYYLKYQNKRADYILAWWNVVNWKEVEARFNL